MFVYTPYYQIIKTTEVKFVYLAAPATWSSSSNEYKG